ncbi:protein FAR1-RELATED SEQUENCE 6 isoform X2 [Elaeis guineensis]|uniref:Protein FAR1-RELATED SEQUENCE n=1 Tax=Elaeis guineensis var. tenera TaxID=51953 RepID=A0A6I9RQC6_ELAGV|nr:protein FAR1-RELATED SEQUENCE 6 [Elaeis guineensis]XP_029122420.1 protein FAR1-RELATED SEQUENCE 6 [Elaeis guineensis]
MTDTSAVASSSCEEPKNNMQNGDCKTSGGNDDRTPQVGMTFRSYDEVSEFYRQYGRHVGFDVRLKRTTLNKAGQYYTVEFMCSRGGKGRTDPSYLARPTAKTNCQATILLKLHGDGLLHVKKVNLEHNHPVDPSMVKLKKHKRKMSSGMGEHHEENEKSIIRRIRRCQPSFHEGCAEGLTSGEDCEALSRRGHLMLQSGDADAMYKFFMHMQTQNPNFFYSIDFDGEGRLRNLLWVDAMSRAAYKYFGDVLLFDTTYLTNDYDLPLVLFLGVNNHSQLILLGCGLLSEETAETYFWLFKTWLACMSSHPPNALITDHCEAIKNAAAKVFPGACHRLCLWQVMKRISETLKGNERCKEIKKALEKVIYSSYRANEFEEDWIKTSEKYGLDNEWLSWLYENRHSWVPLYLKDTFWAGMSMTRRGPSMCAFFDGFIYPGTSLKQFLSLYETALQSKYEKEAQADYESFNRGRNLISKFYMEEQLFELYTHNMFKEFQEELKTTIYCNVSLVKDDRPVSTFEIKESIFLEDGSVTEYKGFEVSYNSEEQEIQCLCRSFQFRGILCRHALSVFKLQVHVIPSRYIVDRWRKDVKLLHALAQSSDDSVANNRLERYNNLVIRCFQLVEVGMTSDDRYRLALNATGELEKFLLNNSTCGNMQVKIVPCETKTNENAENPAVSQLGTTEGDKVLNSLQGKRRGRPPKKRKESDTDTSALSDKKMNDLRTLCVESQNERLLVAPPTLHIGSNIGAQESLVLMGEVSPNDFSLGSHYGVQVDHQHQNGSQSRIFSSDMFQGQFAETVENQSRMQWIHPHMLQEAQLPTATPDQTTGRGGGIQLQN